MAQKGRATTQRQVIREKEEGDGRKGSFVAGKVSLAPAPADSVGEPR